MSVPGPMSLYLDKNGKAIYPPLGWRICRVSQPVGKHEVMFKAPLEGQPPGIGEVVNVRLKTGDWDKFETFPVKITDYDVDHAGRVECIGHVSHLSRLIMPHVMGMRDSA